MVVSHAYKSYGKTKFSHKLEQKFLRRFHLSSSPLRNVLTTPQTCLVFIGHGISALLVVIVNWYLVQPYPQLIKVWDTMLGSW